MSALRMIYLGLAVMGAVVPLWPMLAWIAAEGGSVIGLLSEWKSQHDGNFLVYSITWDLIISAGALSLWVLAETLVRRNWLALLAIPATWMIGVSCGLPLYLFLRTRPV